MITTPEILGRDLEEIPLHPGAARSTIVVAQVLHSLEVGGAEVLAARLARRLSNSGEFRFLFLCLDGVGALGHELRGEGYPVVHVGRSAGLDRRCARRLARAIRDERVDLLHAHQYTPFFYASISRGLRGGPPVLFQEHGRHHPDVRKLRRVLANRLLLRRGDRVVGVGEAVRRALIKNEGIAEDRVGVIYNGIPLARFGVASRPRGEVRAGLGLGPEHFVVIQVARLDYLKDHATALRAFARVLEARPEARLLLVGEGPERPGIETAARAMGLGGAVTLLGLRGDVPDLLAAADVALLTSISEGIPLTLIEAMAAGLPVVSTDVGGVREVVVDGETGGLAPAGDDVALAEAILRLASRPEDGRAMGRSGASRAHALFSEDHMIDGYLRLYQSMLGR